MTAKKEETALTVTEPGQYALVAAQASEQAELMSEALAPGETLELSDLPVIKVPTAGALNWQLPDGDAAKAIEGVIIARQPVRAFWKESFDKSGGGSPPDCTSVDLIRGLGDNGSREGEMSYDTDGNEHYSGRHDCRACPMAAFGSAKNAKGEQAQGQACRQITRLFVLQGGSVLPTLVALPPTSYKEAKKYAVQQPLYSVETSITLVNAQSGGGIKYSKAAFAVNRALEPEERSAMGAYRQAILPFLQQVPINVDAMVAREAEVEEDDEY